LPNTTGENNIFYVVKKQQSYGPENSFNWKRLAHARQSRSNTFFANSLRFFLSKINDAIRDELP